MSCRLDSDMPPLGLLIDDTGPKKQLLWPFTCSPQLWSAYRDLLATKDMDPYSKEKKNAKDMDDGSMLNASLKMVRSNYEYSTVNLSAAAVFTYSSEVAVNT